MEKEKEIGIVCVGGPSLSLPVLRSSPFPRGQGMREQRATRTISCLICVLPSRSEHFPADLMMNSVDSILGSWFLGMV